MYKCKDCGKQFIGGKRRDKSQVITDYVDGKQTLQQLASKYKVSERTIRRDLENMRFVRKKARCKEVTVQLDTTYWGRRFGLMVIKDVYFQDRSAILASPPSPSERSGEGEGGDA